MELLKLVPKWNSWDKFKLFDLKNHLSNVDTKAAIHYLTEYLSILALDEEATNWLIECFKAYFPECTLNLIRQYMILYKKLVAIEDDHQPKRISELTNCIYETIYTLSSNDNMYVEVDVIEQWIIKIARSVPALREHLAELKNKFIYILKNKGCAPDSALKKNVDPC